MYKTVAVTPIGRKVQRGAAFSLLTVIVGGVTLFSVAATIVLALIPIYLQQQTVTPNPNVSRSKPVTMSVEVEEDRTTGKSRSKRSTGDLSTYVPGVFNGVGKDMIRKKLLPFLKSLKVHDLEMISVSLVYMNGGKRKRFALSKRQAPAKHRIVLIIEFYIIFISDCHSTCQTKIGSVIRNALEVLPVAIFDFLNVPIIVNGILVIAPRIEFIAVLFVSVIVSGMSNTIPAVPVLGVDTIGTSTSTTTAAVVSTTPSLVG